MPGAVTLLTPQRALGWARHPVLPLYPVTLNLVLQGRVVRSVLVEDPPPEGHVGQGLRWFDLDLEPLALTEAMLPRLAVILGETDELLPTPLPPEPGTVLRVEEVLSRNLSRPWVRGLTYHDAMRAGRSDADVLDLLYRDILGRGGDPGGMQNYLRLLQGGQETFDGVRRALLGSGECRALRRDVSEAPGAVFSLRLVAQAGAGPGDSVTHLLPHGTPTRSPATAALMAQGREGGREGSDDAGRDGAGPPRPAGGEARVPATGGELAEGWHELEGAEGDTRRWMAREGVVLNPWPALPVRAVTLRVRETHRNLLPALRCHLDATALEPVVEGEPGSPMRVTLRPAVAAAGTLLRLEGLNAGSPREEGVNQDPRTLSIAVEEVVFSYPPG